MVQDKYSEYLDSELMWVREYPSHWSLTKVKYEAYVKARVGWHGLKTDDFTDVGPYLVTGSDFKSSVISWKDCYHCDLERYEQDPYIQLQNGDLLLTKDGTIGKIALVQGLRDDEKATLNSGVFVVRPLRNSFITEFYFWLLESSVFKKFVDYHKTGSTIVHLYQGTFVEFSYASPPLDEQAKIANFLDHETAKIDTLIEKQQTLIQLLKEKRQAVISHAVTKGLNPDAPMKDSGVEWLGEVPEHWDFGSLRWMIDIASGGGLSFSLEKEYSKNMPFPVVGGNGIMGFSNRVNTRDAAIAVGRVGALCGNIHSIDYDSWITDNALKISKWNNFSKDFLVHLLRAANLNDLASKTAQPLITGEQVKALKVVIPPMDEQTAIAEFIDISLLKFNSIEKAAKEAIQLMQERRTALISAAVTGKIDVRGWRASE